MNLATGFSGNLVAFLMTITRCSALLLVVGGTLLAGLLGNLLAILLGELVTSLPGNLLAAFLGGFSAVLSWHLLAGFLGHLGT